MYLNFLLIIVLDIESHYSPITDIRQPLDISSLWFIEVSFSVSLMGSNVE